MSKANQIAQILCKLGQRHLWTPRIAWAKKLKPHTQLYFRTGTGRKTYYMHRGDMHRITIGAACVEDQFKSAKFASRYLAYREITERGYFDSCAEPAEILAHIMGHEFIHFVQSIRGLRIRGYQHDAEFYQALDRFHFGGHAAKLLTAFKCECASKAISLEFDKSTEAKLDYQVGDRVLARAARKIFAGRIVRVNNRSVVLGVQQDGETHRIRIDPAWIEPDTGALLAERSEF